METAGSKIFSAPSAAPRRDYTFIDGDSTPHHAAQLLCVRVSFRPPTLLLNSRAAQVECPPSPILGRSSSPSASSHYLAATADPQAAAPSPAPRPFRSASCLKRLAHPCILALGSFRTSWEAPLPCRSGRLLACSIRWRDAPYLSSWRCDPPRRQRRPPPRPRF